MSIALPDDKQVTVKDRIELTQRSSKIIVERGVGVKLDVHPPHEGEKNWHVIYHGPKTTIRSSKYQIYPDLLKVLAYQCRKNVLFFKISDLN